jgi:hypothetical protein
MRTAVLGLIVALTLPWSALAVEPVEVRYDVFWGGFRAAEIKLIQAGDGAEMAVRATGLLDSLSAFALDAEAQQQRFQSHARSKKSETTLAVDFHGQPPRILIDETRDLVPKKKKPETREPVPEALKAGTMDPLTALISASRRALAGKPGERFTVPVFDGRNRYDAMVTVSGPSTTEVNGRRIAGTKATIQFQPLAGFRKKSRDMWADASFTILLDPETQLPARIVSDNFLVATVISALPAQRQAGG